MTSILDRLHRELPSGSDMSMLLYRLSRAADPKRRDRVTRDECESVAREARDVLLIVRDLVYSGRR